MSLSQNSPSAALGSNNPYRTHDQPQTPLNTMTSPSPIESRIRDASSRNTTLLATLKETDHAIPDLATQNRYISDLQSQINESAARIKTIEAQRAKEFKEHESYRDSVMKRFAYKVSGKREKFESRAKKEEEEYFAALQSEHREKSLKTNLDARIAEAKEVRKGLEGVAQRHNQAQQELDSLYEGIFAGPTPGFPEEDQVEADKDRAIAAYQEMRAQLEGENHVVSLLSSAQKAMGRAVSEMEDALEYSRRDMCGFGGTFTEMMERNALDQAETAVREAYMHVANARRLSGNVRELPPVKIASGSLMGDVFFDNIFSDMAFHDKIHDSMQEVQRCAAAANGEAQRAGQRAQEMTMRLREREGELERARVALQKARERAFERILGGGGGGEEAPTQAATTASAPGIGEGATEASAPPPYKP